ncbi:hypothetical protein BB558_003957 [Smittium angustum]|uniref:Uncharacterized protein n=1 Tax=Smittium angustum TaxID=133377 RepID=A0A2U1J4L0_SMIAN|nr:hypothetical protein BB558_003957 [Smittium angustum]
MNGNQENQSNNPNNIQSMDTTLDKHSKQNNRIGFGYFRYLAKTSQCQQLALVDQYIRGLSKGIMDYLIIVDIPDKLEYVINMATRVDNNLANREMIKDHKSYLGISYAPKSQNNQPTSPPVHLDIPKDSDLWR